jgi:hypothetical protein
MSEPLLTRKQREISPEYLLDPETMIHWLLVEQENEDGKTYEEIKEPARQAILEILLPPLLQL